MTARWMTAMLDTPRGVDVEAFWQAATATSVSARRGARDEFATLQPVGGDAVLRVQDVDGGQAGVHLDVHVDDVPAASARAVELGASTVRNDGDLVLLRSPAGIVFCLVRYRGEQVPPPAVTWPAGHRSLVEQVCLDIPEAVFDREAEFWSALLGWSRSHGELPEFDDLVRPAGMPLRLLLQRLATGDRAGAHLDLSCDDRDAEVRRHVALGAIVGRRTGGWTTMQDPAGREYCVTDRRPLT
jgi:hypothetical protein